jgi:DNA helicase-2/ATP-dependent DNA helicase PcrA
LFKDIHPEMIFNQQTIEEIVGNAAEIDEKQRLILIDSIVLLEEIQKAVILPIDQMTITLGGILFNEPSDLALVHKLALMLKTAGERNAGWTLTDFCAELKDILRSRQKLYGFSEEDLGFDPEMYKGIAVISTFHKAKGLEWDRVYLMSVNNYDFPSLQPDDHYQSEKYFVRDSLNLEAETLALLESTVDDLEGILPLEGSASIDARINYCAERLRLLFVGITRAKSELVITWNTGRFQDCVEALPLRELRSWWEGLHVVG